MQIESAKDLDVYKFANEFAMEIFEITKNFPAEEKYALTSQIRRSSRSVCLNLREAWAKRRYAAHFVSKLTDCDGENSETDSSLDFAKQCGYISPEQHHALTEKCAEIGRMLGFHEATASRKLDRITKALRKSIRDVLLARGMSRRQVEEALDADVRDLNVNVQKALAQERPTQSFKKERSPT